ncbi:MAG: 3-phosphoshikimate 1-carboxyvinyltransferase [Muribaculaceae bacterium]|nr:3-phosphoshikimate 1-carboxyvinyltransferase [Muribaculaceae bacterium]
MNLHITSPEGILEASVDLPLSKSMAARAIIINSVGGFPNSLPLPQCTDTDCLRQALSVDQGNVNIGGCGTAMRFLTAYYAAAPGTDIILDGDERMRKRPIKPLVDALLSLGADIEYMNTDGFAPLHIKGSTLLGGEISIDASTSSQFISALMMVAPLMGSPLRIALDNEPASLAYIKLTAKMMERCGVEPEFTYNGISVPNSPYTTPSTDIERDWSAASYWYSIAALSAGWVTLNDIHRDSMQGDSRMIDIGEKLGVITAESEDVDGALELSASPEVFSRLDMDMSNTPDLVPAVAVMAAALGVPFRFTGVNTLRHKECDRLEALKAEALKMGWLFEIERDDVLSWENRRVPVTQLPRIASHGDHRIAMAFAPLALMLPAIIIENAEVVDKSYPDFWVDLEQAGFIVADEDAVEKTDDNLLCD